MGIDELCHWCGMNQNKKENQTVFHGEVLDKYDDKFEITICEKCFKELFGNNYHCMIRKLIKAQNEL